MPSTRRSGTPSTSAAWRAAKAIVEASVQLGQWQLDGVRDADMGGLLFGVAQLTAARA